MCLDSQKVINTCVCMCVCECARVRVCLCLCELSPCCLGGGGNSISLRLKEFRPPEQGHVLMFSRSFLRSQAVTFNRHSHYPPIAEWLCFTAVSHIPPLRRRSPTARVQENGPGDVSYPPFLEWPVCCWYQTTEGVWLLKHRLSQGCTLELLNPKLVGFTQCWSFPTTLLAAAQVETVVRLANITKQAWGLNFSSSPPPLTWSVSLCLAKCSTCVVS